MFEKSCGKDGSEPLKCLQICQFLWNHVLVFEVLRGSCSKPNAHAGSTSETAQEPLSELLTVAPTPMPFT